MIEVMLEKIKIRQNALIVTALIVLVFLWLWAELAVGIFTNWGS